MELKIFARKARLFTFNCTVFETFQSGQFQFQDLLSVFVMVPECRREAAKSE